jgi:triosephosphate isomerase
MIQRRPLIVGNWKMELSHKAALEVAMSLQKLTRSRDIVCDVVVCPSFPSLSEVSSIFARSGRIAVGAQNIHWEEKGAWTGEVSVIQITGMASYCIVGHSERRELTGENDEEVIQKALLLMRHGLTPIICIGESLEEKKSGRAIEKITSQAEKLFSVLNRVALTKVVIAYEPIWAISSHNTTGREPDPRDVAEVALLLRKIATSYFDQEAADRLRILYGGRVRPDNTAAFMSEPGIDGVLVGGASLHPMQFVEIIEQVQASVS